MTLTARQHEVARLRASGLPRPEIARRLRITPSTVDNHVRAIRARLGVDSRRELAVALQSVEVAAQRSGARSRQGYVPGDSVRVIGGRYAGRAGTYVRRANARQVYVRIGGAVVAPYRRHVQRIQTQ